MGRLFKEFLYRLLPDINRREVSELTAIAPQENLLWVGTKTGTLLLLDVVMIRSLIPESAKRRSSSGIEVKQFSRRSILGNALKISMTTSYNPNDEVNSTKLYIAGTSITVPIFMSDSAIRLTGKCQKVEVSQFLIDQTISNMLCPAK